MKYNGNFAYKAHGEQQSRCTRSLYDCNEHVPYDELHEPDAVVYFDLLLWFSTLPNDFGDLEIVP